VNLVVAFLFELRARGVRVGTEELLALAKALTSGVHDSSLDGFYHAARAILVHRESDLDAFDQAFATQFRGAQRAGLALAEELIEWLKSPSLRRELSAEELAALEALDPETLRRMFEQRMREQKERHDGGNRWIGTGGTSPFGAFGRHPTGLRVGPMGGSRSALGVADARLFRGYRSDLVLDVRQMEMALRRLRALRREGARLELDDDATVDATARNAGELEVVLRPERRPHVRVLLLMDVGGSMDPHVEVVSQLFSAAKRASNVRTLSAYYFHNCIYGHVYGTERFSEPVAVDELLRTTSPKTKLIVVGDAAMHPAELFGVGDFFMNGPRTAEHKSGAQWLQALTDHFPRSAWLNPDVPYAGASDDWGGGTSSAISRIFPMFPLTLDGLTDAVRHLSGGMTRGAPGQRRTSM
jgi:uncharacterized protein with von Willebrand factor type A (vWA) domain